MRSRFYHPAIMIVLCLSLTFIGCGGSGGGSSSGGDGGNGITAAEISEDNAATLSTGALAMGQSANIMSPSGASQDNQGANNSRDDHFRAARIPKALSDAARSIDYSPPLYMLHSSVVANNTFSDTEPGPCGGSVTYTITIHNLSGEFTGTFSFLDYCENGVTINGETDVEGKADVDTGDIISIIFWFDDLTDGTIVMNGKIFMDLSDSPILCTMNAYCTDTITGKVYQAKNYSLNIWEYSDRIEVEIFGTFYYPGYGSVTVSTEEIFVIYDGDEWPTSGILMVFGTNKTKAKLEAINNVFYRVYADTDGDGVYDFDSQNLAWSEYPPFRGIIMAHSYVQYRTYSDAARNQQRGWVEFLKYGQPIEESDISNIVLKDPDQNKVTIDQIIFERSDYYLGYWVSAAQKVFYDGPWEYSGFGIHFPESTTFASGNYTYEATTNQGYTLSEVRYFPGKLELPVVDSSTMTSEWINGDLKLSWTIPLPDDQHDQVRVWLWNEQENPVLPLMIRLPANATEVTIPAQMINNVKQLSNNVQAMDWIVLLYAIEDSTNNSYARSFSDRKPIDGWSSWLDDIVIIASYLQYRTYYDPALSKYQGFVEFQKNGQPIDESDITEIVLKDPDQNEVTIDQIIFYDEDYYFGAWNSGQVNYSGPWEYTGFSIHFPESTTFSIGNYTYEAKTSQGVKLSDTRYFPNKLELPVVDSTTMTSEWINGDLKLNWTIPIPDDQHDQVRVWLYNEQNNPELPLMIRLPNNATEVTIPAQVISNVKQLSNNVPTMKWLVLLYTIEDTTDNWYARSFSERINIEGWSN